VFKQSIETVPRDRKGGKRRERGKSAKGMGESGEGKGVSTQKCEQKKWTHEAILVGGGNR